MLRKRSRSIERDQPMGYPSDHKVNNFFNIPALFVGLTPKAKGLFDSDSVRSPTSPLDFRVFCNSPRSLHHFDRLPKSKVGLSIVDSLDDDLRKPTKFLEPSESNNIIFGSRMRTTGSNCHTHFNSFDAPKSLPNSFAIFPQTHTKSRLQTGNTDVAFEITDAPFESQPIGKPISCSLDSGRPFPGLTNRNPNSRFVAHAPVGESLNCNNCSHVELKSMPKTDGSGGELSGSLSTSEIELSEDYTRVTLHGSKPKTTHIYDDCILECYTNVGDDFGNKEELEIMFPMSVQGSKVLTPYLSSDFLSFCCSCNKKLEEGKDIYIYRGEKAFCSLECRSQEILIDEELENNNKESWEKPPNEEEEDQLFEIGIFIVST